MNQNFSTMRGSDSVIDHFFIGRIIKIPVYQRNYSWDRSNCKQLFDDIVMLMNNEGKKHFFGSIIYMIDQDTDERVIIDGQQRLTTIAILLAAMRDSCEKGVIHSSKEKFVEKISDKLFDDGEVILHTVERDRVAYDNLIRKKIADPKTNVGSNYLYFMRRIENMGEHNADDLKRAIERLQVMVITLNLADGDNPQAVFDSINSTGKNLEEGDRIRNLILMNLDLRTQNYYHKEYWVEIENNVPNLSLFFRDYLTVVTGKIPNKDATYQSFRDYQSLKERAEYEDFLKEIREYSEIYMKILNNDLDEISKIASIEMFHINHIDANVVYPFIMRILYEHRHRPDMISTDDVQTIMVAIENYLVRRLICNAPTNAMNTIFSSIFKSIINMPGEGSFSDKFIRSILLKIGTSRYPRDSEVRECLNTLNLYDRRKLCTIVLSAIEHNNRDTEDTLLRVSRKELTVEHVMPQKISERWIKDLGENAKETHDNWVNKLGNLTLTGYNSEYSNRPYSEKRDLDIYGFKHSGLKLNEYMRNSEVWTAKEMSERHQLLIERFIEVMPEVTSSYNPPAFDKEEQLSVYDDWNDMWGNKICGYVLDGIRTYCKNAGDTFSKLILELYDRDPDTFLEQCEMKGNGQFGRFIVNEESKKCILIKDGVYLRYDFDNETKIRLLRILSDAMGLDSNSLLLLVNITKEGFHRRTTLQDLV